MEENEISERLDVVHRSRQMLTVRFRSRTKSKDIVKNGGEESWGSPIGAMNTLGENCEEWDWKATRISGCPMLSEPSPCHPCDGMRWFETSPHSGTLPGKASANKLSAAFPFLFPRRSHAESGLENPESEGKVATSVPGMNLSYLSTVGPTQQWQRQQNSPPF